MNRVVCKFNFQKPMKDEHGSTILVQGFATTNDDVPEDARFHKATPNGQISLYVSNPTAIPFFADGGTMYLTISKKNPFGPEE